MKILGIFGIVMLIGSVTASIVYGVVTLFALGYTFMGCMTSTFLLGSLFFAGSMLYLAAI